MTAIYLEIKTMSPLLLADGPPAGNLTHTLDYIPGSVLLGMLARRYIAMNSTTDALFDKIFLDGGVIFDHAYIGGGLPIPQSARTCKYFPGFYEMRKAHGVVDLLLAQDNEVRCPNKGENCSHPTDYFHGYYVQQKAEGGDNWSQARVNRRIITRTAIDAAFGGAAEKKLYSHEVIEEGQTFKAKISFDESRLEAPLRKLLDTPFEARIGKGCSRGLGWVSVNPCEPFGPALDPAAQRAPYFQHRDGRFRLVATLLSDAFFSDDYLRDITLPNISHFKGVKGIKPDQWNQEISYAFADTRIVSGFQGPPWNLPREPRLAVSAGSVILFNARDGVQPDLPADEGIIRIGDRTAEGYGRALLWSPFHHRLKPDREVSS